MNSPSPPRPAVSGRRGGGAPRRWVGLAGALGVAPLAALPLAVGGLTAGQRGDSVFDLEARWIAFDADLDGDGWLSRRELAPLGLERWADEADRDELPPRVWRRALRRDLIAEALELFEMFDSNRDGSWSPGELPERYAQPLRALDRNGDARIDRTEVQELPDLTAFDPFMLDDGRGDALAWEAWVDSLLEDGPVRLDGLGPVAFEELRDFDFDGNGLIARREVDRGTVLDEEPVRFQVRGNVARAYGLLTSELTSKVERLLVEHPELRWLELAYVPGTIDEDAVFDAADLLRQHGIHTRVPAGCMIASGGLILLACGDRREVAEGARVGVHSWSYRLAGVTLDGRDLPRTAPDHAWALGRLRELDLPDAFYWFELRTPSADLHWMTPKELRRYGFTVIPTRER